VLGLIADREELMNTIVNPSINHARRVGLSWVAVSITLVATAQLLLKIGIARFTASASLSMLLSIPLSMEELQNVNFTTIDISALLIIGVGLFCYLISVISWLRALEQLPLNVTYPLLSLSYPLVYLGAITLPMLHETASLVRTGGVLLIMLGVVLLAPSKEQNHE
jgi:undecaprenyl phosphate-alpha-L-ara4N flippase subunit ArnF